MKPRGVNIPLGIPPLAAWYAAHKRVMPWRGHPDPYAVWISEIMLQQTQVDTARPYFARFISRFPDVAALAAAPVADLLKAWEGLGYYTRAHNLQKAAKILAAEHNGALPQTPDALAQLPGIGPYTSAAIASICFNVPAPVVDGNVIRVFARCLAWPDNFKTPVAAKKLRDWLAPHIRAVASPGDFNQAIMELGALVCTPKNPACDECPLAAFCIARRDETQLDFPVKPPAKKLPHRHLVGLHLSDAKGRVLFVQRVDEKFLPGLWELPNDETPKAPTPADARRLLLRVAGLEAAPRRGPVVTQVFSHFQQTLSVFILRHATGAKKIPPHAAWISDPATIPLTRTARRVLSDMHNPQ